MSNSLIKAYLNEDNMVGSEKLGYQYLGMFYVGAVNSIDKSIVHLLKELYDDGLILTREPEIVSFVDGEPIFVILFTALPKLQYLEWKYAQAKALR